MLDFKGAYLLLSLHFPTVSTTTYSSASNKFKASRPRALMGIFDRVANLISSTMSALDLDLQLEEEPSNGPTVEDVLLVKDIFREFTPLPLEIVDEIIDYAEYWPHTTTSAPRYTQAVGGDKGAENRFVVCHSVCLNLHLSCPKMKLF